MVSGSPDGRRGLDAVRRWPAASVTEIAAKRGSTGSLNVSRTSPGARSTTRLADGTARTRTAWAYALEGASSAVATTAASAAQRFTGVRLLPSPPAAAGAL